MAYKSTKMHVLKRVVCYPSIDILKKIAGISEYKKINESKAIIFLLEKGYNSLNEFDKRSIDDCFNKNNFGNKVIERRKKKIAEFIKNFQ